MTVKEQLAVHKRMQAFVTNIGHSWNAPGVTKFIRVEIDRAVRKARKEARGQFAQQLADVGCEHVNVGRRKPKERR